MDRMPGSRAIRSIPGEYGENGENGASVYICTEYGVQRTAKLHDHAAFRILSQMPPIAAVTGNLINSERPKMCQAERRFRSPCGFDM